MKIINPMGVITASAVAGARMPAWSEDTWAIRVHTAASTATMQITVSASIHHCLTSLPVPRPCSTATGQLAYASQWTVRHAR